MVLVTEKAPDFTAPVVMPDGTINEAFKLSEYAQGKKVVLLFYPLDFTFVCPSEILSLDKRVHEFQKRDTLPIAISVDSHYTHLAYRNTPVDQGGIGSVQMPMVADLTKQISADYGVLVDAGVALRGTFLIDQNFVVRHQLVNDLPIGRSIDDTLRVIDALLHHEKHGEVCPAGWKKGDEAMHPTPEGVANYLRKHA